MLLRVMQDRTNGFAMIPVAGVRALSILSIIGLVLIGLLEAGCGPPI
jgi:hypothetical protein